MSDDTARNYTDQADDFEALADTLAFESFWYSPKDWPSYLEIRGPNHDGSYRGGETSRIRIVAHGGDPEAGAKILGLTGNEVTTYEITLTPEVPRGATTALAEQLLGEMLDDYLEAEAGKETTETA